MNPEGPAGEPKWDCVIFFSNQSGGFLVGWSRLIFVFVLSLSRGKAIQDGNTALHFIKMVVQFCSSIIDII